MLVVGRPFALYHRSSFFTHRQKPLWNHTLSVWFSTHKKKDTIGKSCLSFCGCFELNDTNKMCLKTEKFLIINRHIRKYLSRQRTVPLSPFMSQNFLSVFYLREQRQYRKTPILPQTKAI